MPTLQPGTGLQTRVQPDRTGAEQSAPQCQCRSRQLGKNSLRNGGHHHHHHHAAPSNTTTDPCSPIVSEKNMSSCYLVRTSTCPAWMAAPRQLLAACSCFASSCIVVSCFWAAAAVLLTRSAHAHIPSHALRRYKQGTANCQTMGTLLLDVQTTTTTTRCAARLLLSPWRNTDTTTTRRGSFPPVCTLPNELGNGSRTFPFLSHCTPSSRLVQRRSRTMTQDAFKADAIWNLLNGAWRYGCYTWQGLSLSFWRVVGGCEAVGMSYCVVTDGLVGIADNNNGMVWTTLSTDSPNLPEAVATQPFNPHSNHSSRTLKPPTFLKVLWLMA